MLTAKIPVVSCSASRCSAGNSKELRFQRFSGPPQPAQRAADKERRFRARAASGPRSPSCSRDGSRFGLTDYRAAGLRYAMAGGRLGAAPGCQRERQGGAFCRQHVQTGRRLMRQTVLPTKIQGRIASTRSESSARRFQSLGFRSAGRPGLRFGLPLPPESGGPSRHPAAQYARTVIRARRRQEFQNAQQNAHRCHPPGRDPGGRGPRQSRRRI
jgi:hypothetical protein